MVRSKGSPGKPSGKSLVAKAIAGVISRISRSPARATTKNSNNAAAISNRPSRYKMAASTRLMLHKPRISSDSKMRRMRSGKTCGTVTPLIQGEVSSRYFTATPSNAKLESAPAKQAFLCPDVCPRRGRLAVGLLEARGRMACQSESPRLPLRPRPRPTTLHCVATNEGSRSSCHTICQTYWGMARAKRSI
jgi:hypothetical protein